MTPDSQIRLKRMETANSPPGKYACVACKEPNGEESQIVIPYNWIDEENAVIYWSTSIHARREFAECAPINKTWATYPFVKIIVEGSKLKFFSLYCQNKESACLCCKGNSIKYKLSM